MPPAEAALQGEFTVSLTAQDLAAANWLLVRRHWLRRWAPWFVPLAGLLFGLLLVLSARHFHPDLAPRRALSIFAKGVMFALIFLGLQLFILLRIIVRSTRSGFGEADRHDLHYSYDPTALTMTLDGRTSVFPWTAFRRTIEDPNWLLLCRSEATFCAFPKSQLDAGALIALKRALDQS